MLPLFDLFYWKLLPDSYLHGHVDCLIVSLNKKILVFYCRGEANCPDYCPFLVHTQILFIIDLQHSRDSPVCNLRLSSFLL